MYIDRVESLNWLIWTHSAIITLEIQTDSMKFTILILDPFLVIITINIILYLSYPWPSVYKKRKTLHFAMPSTRTPAPEVIKFTNFLEPSLVSITMYLICLIHTPVNTRRGEDKMHFHKMTHVAHLNTRTPTQGVMKFTTLIDPTLVINIKYTLYLVCLIYASE